MNLNMKCQVAVEFLIFVGLTFLVTVIFIGVSVDDAKELSNRKEYFLIRDTALMIQNEIDTASQVEDGYERNFTLSSTLDNIQYNLSIKNNVLSIWTENSAYVTALPNSSGNLIKGANKITKVDDVVFINQ